MVYFQIGELLNFKFFTLNFGLKFLGKNSQLTVLLEPVIFRQISCMSLWKCADKELHRTKLYALWHQKKKYSCYKSCKMQGVNYNFFFISNCPELFQENIRAFFQNITFALNCSISDNIELERGEITRAGFIKLNEMEADDNEGDTDDLWITLTGMGFNKSLIIDEVNVHQPWLPLKSVAFIVQMTECS